MEEMTWWVKLLWALGWWNWDRERNTWRFMRKKKHQAQTVFADPSGVPADYTPTEQTANAHADGRGASPRTVRREVGSDQ